MVHCNSNLQFYQEIKHKVVEFLWDNKHAKIAYDQLIADKSQGGIKLVDLTKILCSKLHGSIEFFIPKMIGYLSLINSSLLQDLIFENVIWMCKMQKA